jgi:putative ABC transport system permease protein
MSLFSYYLQQGIRSLRRTPVLTGLMVLSIAVGIGASMTTLTVMHLLSGDPLPGRSQHLYYPQVDASPRGEKAREEPLDMLDYTSAVDLWREGPAERKALISESPIKLSAPGSAAPASISRLLSTTADFFPMFQVPMAYGTGWSSEDDERRARVAVISWDLNQRLFGGKDSVGQMLRIRDSEVRIIGVLKPWRPAPLYYRVAGGRFAQGDTADFYGPPQEVMVPFFTGLQINAGHFQQFTCWGDLPEKPGHLENTNCVWLQQWVQLDTPAQVAGYEQFLQSYVQQQNQLGRISQPELVRLRSLMQWLDFNGVVPRDVRLQAWMALAFLGICLFNTIGLLLAKFLRRTGEIGVLRALGATRGMIFKQCLTEAALIGLAGGLAGLLLTLFGLWSVRQQPLAYADMMQLDLRMLGFTLLAAITTTLLAGLLPALRAARIDPALQIKAL